MEVQKELQLIPTRPPPPYLRFNKLRALGFPRVFVHDGSFWHLHLVLKESWPLTRGYEARLRLGYAAMK
jgi:hypothetical protein